MCYIDKFWQSILLSSDVMDGYQDNQTDNNDEQNQQPPGDLILILPTRTSYIY